MGSAEAAILDRRRYEIAFQDDFDAVTLDEARWLPVSTSGLFATYGECEAEAVMAAEAAG